MKRCLIYALMGVLGLFLVVGCSAPTIGGVSKDSSLANEFKDAPEWVRNHQCPAGKEFAGMLCAVGSHRVLGSGQINLAQRTSLLEAASAAALIIRGRVETIETNYAGEYTQGIDDQAADFDSKSRTYSERWAKMELPGFTLVDHWISPNNNMYALGKVDVESIMQTLKRFDGLTARQKKVIDQHEEEMRDLLSQKPDM